MKAIFAVSALAAAISAQAMAADTEVTTSVSGAVTFKTTVDFEGSVDADGKDATEIDVYLDSEDDADDGGAYGAYIAWDIQNGPFSATITVQGEDNGGTDGVVDVVIEDVMVEEGALSFGQLGALDSTDEYTHLQEDAGVTLADVDAAFRYTAGDFAVQLEGVQGTDGNGTANTTLTGSDFGLGAQYSGSSDALSYVVEAQVRASSLSPSTSEARIFLGAGATYTADMFTVAAAANYTQGGYLAADPATELAFSVTAMPTDASSLYAKGTYVSGDGAANDGASETTLGATYSLDSVGLEAAYTLVEAGADASNLDNGSDFAMVKATYAANGYDYYASVEVYMDEGEDLDPLFEAGVSTSTDSGITYAADFDFQADTTTQVALSAAYSF